MDDLEATPFGRARLRAQEAQEAGFMASLPGVPVGAGQVTDVSTVMGVHTGLTSNEIVSYLNATVGNVVAGLIAQAVSLDEAIAGAEMRSILVGYFLRDEQVKAAAAAEEAA
jgi:hypothetical protein